MECDFNYLSLVNEANPNSTLRMLQSIRKSAPDDRKELQISKKMSFLSPTEYIKCMTYCPESILCKNIDDEKFKSCAFLANPRIVVFKTFEIGYTYNMTFTIKNTSKLPRHLRLLTSENVSFNVTFKGSTFNTRIPPGITHIYDVEFHPDELRNYFHDIVFKTDDKPFVVQVVAAGPQALLSFPDQIDMGQTGVKVTKMKPILLQNVGEVFTGFSIFTDNPCFTVIPPKGTINPGKVIQMNVEFTPTKSKISNGNIFIRYESGETVQCIIYGEGVHCDVKIHEEKISIENTYLDLSRLFSIEIQNNSDYLLKYEWVQYKSTIEDLKEKEKCIEAIDVSQELELNNIDATDISESIRKRLYSDQVEIIKNKSFAYCNDHYQIFPLTGEVWPHKNTKVSVTFRPQKVGSISTIAYLEIQGQEERIPVCLLGICVGPAIELNLLSLDIQDVYLCSTYNYEVVCQNVGPITGTLKFIEKNANFGSTIMVEPSEIVLNLNDLKSMKLSFYSNRTGNFIERVDFLIKESSEVLSFVLKGNVICPLLRTDCGEIIFHRTSLCFTSKRIMCFLNLSHTPIEYDIRVLSDGYEMPITHEEFARAQIKPMFPSSPREFFVSPCQGVVEPKTSLQIELAYTPNKIRSDETKMQICLCKSTNAEPMLIPIKFRAKRAILNVVPNEISIPLAFVNFSYTRKLTISNYTKIEGYFYFIPQKISSKTTIYFSLSAYQGYLKPGQCKEVTITIIVKRVGLQCEKLSLLTLGLQTPFTCCEIMCDGQGPIVNTRKTHLNWGEVQLLKKKSLTLELTNDSPITAEFTISLNKTKNIWEVEPSSGELEPNETAAISVTVKLRDTGKFTDRLLIAIFNGQTISINLSALGVGTCVVFEPEIYPKFDMGFLFSHQDINIPITLRNEGTRHHLVFLTIIEKARQGKKNSSEEIPSSKFKIEPSTIELLPGAEKIINCKIRSNLNKIISEKWYVYATIEDQGKREFLGASEFIATFIEPKVVFDKRQLIFILDFEWTDVMLQQKEGLQLTNQSGRDLTTHIKVDSPFAIIDKCGCLIHKIDTVFKDKDSMCLCIYFPFDVENSKLIPQTYEGYINIEYEEHKNIDKILCRAKVNFPHLAFESDQVQLYCATGYSAEEKVKLINDTPLPVFYTLKWIKESFVYESLSMIVEKGVSEDSMPDTISKADTSISNDLLTCKCDSNVCQNEKNYDENLPGIQNKWDMTEYYENAEEISEKSLTLELETIDLIDKFLQIVPGSGQIFPYGEQYVTFVFNGLENAKISAQAICEIARGTPQILYVNAISDTVKCKVPQDDVLDFGLQIFCESATVTLKLTNQCLIPLHYGIEMSCNLLRVIEGPQTLKPNADSFIEIEHLPSAPGKFQEKLFLEITHLEPFVINVQWFATIPQIYIDTPRCKSFTKYPVEFGYQAVQLVILESSTQEQYSVETKCSSTDSDTDIADIPEFDMIQLTSNDWQIISCDEKYPSVYDIDLAFERLIVRNYIESNEEAFTILNSDANNKEIPLLLAPSYLINMKYVLVEQNANLSLSLRNYGYEKANVKLIKEKKKNKLPDKTCIHVHIDKNTEICQCESIYLNITFSPKKHIFSQKRTDVSYKFYLEVRQGLTIPVNVQASAVYPRLNASVQSLNFDKVFVGECREMGFLLKNDGYIKSQWEIVIENPSKNLIKPKENPFYVCCSSNVFAPNEASVIKVYFKPYKNGIQKRNLLIMIENSQETMKIRLIGCGIERNININRTDIKFPPLIPNTKPLKESFIIINENQYPIELYWQHLENFKESNKIYCVLKHYYRTDNLLIPQRKINENVPELLIKFYNCLTYQMSIDDNYREIIDNMNKSSMYDTYSEQILMNRSKSKEEKKLKNETSLLDLKKMHNKEDEKKANLASLLTNFDANAIETLVHEYIDKLQRNPKFSETMLDPLAALNENYRREMSLKCSEGTLESTKKLIIIFHGAPFTEYQETACRVAKALNLPLLNLNELLLDAAAFAETQRTNEFVKHFNHCYKDVVTKFTAMLRQKSLTSINNKIENLSKMLPSPEELEQMDPYSQFEHKFEVLVKNLELSDSLGLLKSKEKPSVKNKDATWKKQNILPNVNENLFRDVFRERLLQPKYKYGYILQSLQNEFIKNETVALKILLEATGKVETRWFMTFHNSMELYELRIQNLNRIKAEEEENRINELIKNFEDMTESEIDLLSESDKIIYDNFVNGKQQESESQELEATSITDGKKKKTKEELSTSRNKRKDTTKSISLDKESEISEFDQVCNAMIEYINSLNKLLEFMIELETKNSLEASKSAKKKDKSISSADEGVKPTETFFVWHIRSEDPWDQKIYDLTLCQIKQSFAPFEWEYSIEDKLYQLSMEIHTYSILKEYEMSTQSQSDVFTVLPGGNPCKTSNLSVDNNESDSQQKMDNEEYSETPKIEILNPRCVLQPHESLEFQIEFNPTEEGCYEDEFFLTLVDNADMTYNIKCVGFAENPKLDLCPCSVFDRVQTCKASESHKPTYYLSSEVYDFGSLLIMHTENKSYKKTTQFKFKNISSVCATVNFSLFCEQYDCFEISSRRLEIKADETGTIDVTACALKCGCIVDNLMISLNNDNEKREKIQLLCNGIELNVDLYPKKVNFERILIDRMEKRIILLRNKSAITIYWHLSTNVESKIQLIPTKGKLIYKGSCEIELQYYADKVNKTDSKNLSFEIFLNEDDLEPVATDNITITAETYEILFEINSDVIDFENMPVTSTKKESLTITNLGLYEIEYKIQLQENEILRKTYDLNTISSFKENFDIQPNEGLILAKKSATINITYTPSIEIILKSAPLFKCMIIEPHKNIGVVDEKVLNVSAVSYYTRFSIEPFPLLNFGTLALKAAKIMALKITNTGEFLFKYSIINQPKKCLDESDKKHIKNESKTRKSSKQAIKSASVGKWDPFYLEKITGELNPEESEMITVRCCSDVVGNFNEKLVFLVSDSLPLNIETQQVVLVANVCVPEIDFKNYNEIFAESYIVDSYEEFVCPNEFAEHSVFSKNTFCIHFCRVCIGGSYTTCINLRNISFVHGDVLIEIIGPCEFKTNVNRLSIPPMSKQSFTVTFKPNLLEKFSGLLKIKLDLPENIKQGCFCIDLYGESCVPQINILEPVSKSNNNVVINFGLSFIDETYERTCTIQNVGQIADKVTVQVLDDPNEAFNISIDSDKEMDCGLIINDDATSTLTTRINSKEIVNIKIYFLPRKIIKYESRIQIVMEKNPYEIIEIDLLGKSYGRSVIFENLDMEESPTIDNIIIEDGTLCDVYKIFEAIPIAYKLDYEKCFLNQSNKINFKIVNKSSYRYFRFEFEPHPNFTYSPSAGHLAPYNYKQETITFCSKEPITLCDLVIDCLIEEIILNRPNVDSLWDTRQLNILWEEKDIFIPESHICDDDILLQKVIVQTEEPEYELVPDATQHLHLLVSAIVDYSDYNCDVKCIDFENTLMLQTREYQFTLQNTGEVNLNYAWVIIMDEQYPIRLDESKLKLNSSFESNESFSDKKYLSDVKKNVNKSKELKFTEDSKMSESSDLFSTSAGLANRSTDTWIEGDDLPFQIIPEYGCICPCEDESFTLIFSPKDVFKYKAYLQCNIENLNPDTKSLNIVIRATSLLPYCHFDIKESDYLSSGRRDIKLPVPSGYSLADPDTINKIKIVEFKIMGIGECHTRQIYLINPTTEEYSYRWFRLSNQVFEKVPSLQCLSEIDVIESGKRKKISFCIIPEAVGIYESFWQFEIKKYDIKTLFLIVINVVEPSLTFQHTLIKLETSAIGEVKCASFEIKNNENCPLSFQILANSLYSEGRLQNLTISPTSGILRSNSPQIFDIEYKPSLIGEHSFNIQCQIEKLKKPINISVSVRVIELSPKLTYIDLDDQEMELSADCDNTIDIGNIMLYEKMKLKFKIENTGSIDFDYSWNLSDIQENTFDISMSENENTIEANSMKLCELKVLALEKIAIRNYSFALKIKCGPTYCLKLNASARKAPLEFSFLHYDFGPSYIQTQNGIMYSVDLKITNNQKTFCSVKCDYKENCNIKVNLNQLSQAIPPNATVKIPIHFQPTVEKMYEEILYFTTVDCSVKQYVTIIGEGVIYRIRLRNRCDTIVDFGTILFGKTLTRKIYIINEGCVPVKLKIDVIEYSSEDLQQTNSNTGENILDPLQLVKDVCSADTEIASNTINDFDLAEFIEFTPKVMHNLKPNREMEVTIKFKGVRRVKLLKAKLGLKIDSFVLPLTIVKGNCTAASFYLNRTYISFGTIYEGCVAIEKLSLINNGDLGSRFHWKKEKTQSHFILSPLSGYCSSGSEIMFTCTFKPNFATSCIQSQFYLELENHEHLSIKVSGNCSPIPEATETIEFLTQIRQSETKEIQVFNDSDKTWDLKPMIFGEHFTTVSELSVDPNTTESCTITYKPKKTTCDNSLNKGKITIILPDEKPPILYNLCGRCIPIPFSEKIVREIPAKQNFVESLIVYNNSDISRNFICKAEPMDTGHKKIFPVMKVDVPAKKQIYYEFPFYFENEGHFAYKITFDDHEENCQCYEIEFNVSKPEIKRVIELTTYVRSLIFYMMKIENPSEQRVLTFYANNVHNDIIIHGLPMTLAPLTFKNIKIEYLPLIPCDEKVILEISSKKLGSTFYELHLVAKTAFPEKTVNIKTSLGKSIDFTLKLKNYTKIPSDFEIMVDDPSFTCPESFCVPAREEIEMDVRFEPYKIGTTIAKITAASKTAGEFVFPIHGQTALPQPQGPFTVTFDKPIVIKFKNIFQKTMDFYFSVHNTDFTINSQREKIPSMKSFEIIVRLKDDAKDSDRPKTGRLIIKCNYEDSNEIEWIYYLKRAG